MTETLASARCLELPDAARVGGLIADPAVRDKVLAALAEHVVSKAST